jgi:hypothetical protein
MRSPIVTETTPRLEAVTPDPFIAAMGRPVLAGIRSRTHALPRAWPYAIASRDRWMPIADRDAARAA